MKRKESFPRLVVLIAAEAAGWLDGLDVAEIEVADCSQGLGRRRVLERLGHRFQPGPIFSLQCCQLGDRVEPTPGATAMVGLDPTVASPAAKLENAPKALPLGAKRRP